MITGNSMSLGMLFPGASCVPQRMLPLPELSTVTGSIGVLTDEPSLTKHTWRDHQDLLLKHWELACCIFWNQWTSFKDVRAHVFFIKSQLTYMKFKPSQCPFPYAPSFSLILADIRPGLEGDNMWIWQKSEQSLQEVLSADPRVVGVLS